MCLLPEDHKVKTFFFTLFLNFNTWISNKCFLFLKHLYINSILHNYFQICNDPINKT